MHLRYWIQKQMRKIGEKHKMSITNYGMAHIEQTEINIDAGKPYAQPCALQW